MHFIETFGLRDLVVLTIAGRSAFYLQLSVAARLGLIVAHRMRIGLPDFRRLEIGDLQAATEARKAAYATAEHRLRVVRFHRWAHRVGQRLGIDFSLIAEKHLFDRLYGKYFFYEIVLRYVTEHPSEAHALTFDRDDAESYLQAFAACRGLTICACGAAGWLNYFIGLVGTPLLLVYHRPAAAQGGLPVMQGALVCAVDAEVTRAMFARIFNGAFEVDFVFEPQYERVFADPDGTAGGAVALRLSRTAWWRLVTVLPSYLAATVSHAADLVAHGALPFTLFHLLCQGRKLVPDGKGNVFVTFEHLTLPRAVRNEFLRADGSISVYLPKNSYVTYRQYPAERQINYDVFCSPGPHAEELYRFKRAAASCTFLKTGSFDTHCVFDGDDPARIGRKADLNQFKAAGQLVTILSPGICDETSSHERRLMQLAARLAGIPGIRVVVRMKPGTPGAEYASFYHDILDPGSQVRLTGSEFELFDFIGPSDLFVTSISTSACDIALRGGDVLFVDFMRTPDLYLPWEKVPEIVLSDRIAYEKIADWLADDHDGPARTAHRLAMGRLRAVLGYRHGSCEAYRRNLLGQLQPWLARIRAVGAA